MESTGLGSTLNANQTTAPKRSVAVIGAGWAGLAAAVRATQNGDQVTLFEATQQVGGRARCVNLKPLDSGVAGARSEATLRLDNGQHILIGAYHRTLDLMRTVGVNPQTLLMRLPLTLRYPDQSGFAIPRLPFPLNLAVGILAAQGWSAADKWGLLQTAWQWQRSHFSCAAQSTVADICKSLSPPVWRDLIEPLCVAALNTPAEQASAAVFLRVLKDALWGPSGSSDLLLPQVDLGRLMPEAARAWLEQNGALLVMGHRVEALSPVHQASGTALVSTCAGSENINGWHINGEFFDHVVIATPALDAANLVHEHAPAWAAQARNLKYQAIATVYVQAALGTRLSQPMLALRTHTHAPAQFVFDRGQICIGPHTGTGATNAATPGLLAFVASAPQVDRMSVQSQVLEQAREQLNLNGLHVLQTVMEKRATLACTPGLIRPLGQVTTRLTACGDYIAGPYPSTLEGAVRSGFASL